MQVMETEKKVLGPEHPDRLASMTNLAVIWKSQGKDQDAIALMSQCIRLCEQQLGQNHPDTVFYIATLNDWQTKRVEPSEQVERVEPSQKVVSEKSSKKPSRIRRLLKRVFCIR